jgi:hypothetical protein
MVTMSFDEKKWLASFLGGNPVFFNYFSTPHSKILQGSKSFFYIFKGVENHENTNFP